MNPRPRKLHLLRLLPDRWVRTAGPGAQKSLYLSFDDGPHPEHTVPLLEQLAAHDARATFFLIGDQVERFPEIVHRIVAAGHQLGNHSYSHPDYEKLTLAEQLDQIERTDRLLQQFDSRAQHPFRPPRGVLPLALLWHLIRIGRPIAFWSYDSLDYARHPLERLVEVARRHPTRAGDIILMHDDSPLSSQLLQQVLPLWKSKGFGFEALPPDPL